MGVLMDSCTDVRCSVFSSARMRLRVVGGMSHRTPWFFPPPGPCTCARILSVCTCEDKLINWLDGPVEVYYFYFCALRKAIECIQHVPVLCIMHSAQCVWHRASTGKYVCT